MRTKNLSEKGKQDMKLINLIFTLSLLISSSAYSHEALETDNWNDVIEKVEELSKTYNKKEILTVFDLDDTLLTGRTNLGSVAWFDWQSDLLKSGETEGRVADDFDGLLSVQLKLSHLGSTVEAAPNTSASVKRLQELSGNSIILTSRSYFFRDISMKDLKEHDIDFSQTQIPLLQESHYTYDPIAGNQVEKLNLTEKQIQDYKLYRSRPVSYSNGAYLTAGQHKASMLQLLLNKARKSYKAIIFVDDTNKHHVGMHDFYKGRTDMELITFHFTALDEAVDAFNKSDKRDVIEGWENIKKAANGAL